LTTSNASSNVRAVIASALRTYVRYAVPLTVISALALSPVLVLAFAARPPTDAAAARSILRLTWELIGVAAVAQLLVVGGVTPAARAIAAGRPLSQGRALAAGIGQLIRAFVPCVLAALTIAIGSLALVVPGVLLCVLLSLTGACAERGIQGAMADSIAVARRQLPRVAAVVAGMLVADVAVVMIARMVSLHAPLAAKPTPDQLLAICHLVHVVAIALVVVAPLPATVLATIRARTTI
jgi:hypothetical protein